MLRSFFDEKLWTDTVDIASAFECFYIITFAFLEQFILTALHIFLARAAAFLDIIPVWFITKVVKYKAAYYDKTSNPNNSADKEPNHRLTTNSTVNKTVFISHESVAVEAVFTIDNSLDAVVRKELWSE